MNLKTDVERATKARQPQHTRLSRNPADPSGTNRQNSQTQPDRSRLGNALAALLAAAAFLNPCLTLHVHAQPSTPSHPLDPLNANEILAVGEILQRDGRAPTGALFPEITLQEPPKAEVLAWRPGQPFRREAQVVMLDLPSNRLTEGRVDLRTRQITEWRHIPGAQPLLTDRENSLAIEITRTNAAWQSAMQRRGLTNFAAIALTPWAPGHLRLPGPPGARVVRVLSYWQGSQRNSYGPPIEGVEALVDLSQGRVIDLSDTGPRPVPTFRPTTSIPPSAAPTGRPCPPCRSSSPPVQGSPCRARRSPGTGGGSGSVSTPGKASCSIRFAMSTRNETDRFSTGPA